ncbi:hypothetical protein ATY35_02910 [Vibrio cidicii]|uniref:Lon N-terminal domain-containing protein n=1 Tax=Vibrio cidicii TaxID=1763883 RepID=A0A151KWU3_9VIBR|nr:LON peptidase substrate-binding domain-containing protein [Vibrio cidicii]ELV8623520.1 LON peptidase substrate-binding domain-containing protein [Vibrio cidicii]KYN25148.1 hypothetical protein AUQ44_05245 [Vibrio cidicii]KYN82375.1 hypothetical protein ATY36_01060 [Vibrio cidicii]KYN86224.1 hypothetical protein ATY35_02910 [Vibrio cidicii]KYN87369.1 hypothetical protein ATY37_19230 [Vibrio cidicii]
MTQLMLFPLSSTVLPSGKMKLRIFEPRYKRMVKTCCEHNMTFGMCLVDRSAGRSTLSQCGTEVKIIDFDVLPDGLLGITVQGVQRFTIEQIALEEDGLRLATVQPLLPWPQTELPDQESYLGKQLEQIYAQFPQLGELYPQRLYTDANWVTQRWLEILPLSVQQFEQFAGHADCSSGLNFLSQVVEDDSARVKH